MKILLILVVLIASLTSISANALYIDENALSTTIIVLLLGKEEANIVNKDSQAYFNTGEVSPYLSQKIKDICISNDSLSEEDALDALIINAQNALK